MRHGIVGMLTAALALAMLADLGRSATAQTRNLPDTLMGVVTAPLGAIMQGPRRARPPNYRRVKVKKPKPAAVARPQNLPAAPAAGVATAVGTASAIANPSDAIAAKSAPSPSDTTPVATVNPSQTRGTEPPQASAQPSQRDRPQPRLGALGPMTWPTAFEDILGYSLWPGQYADRMRGHGIGTVIGAVFSPMSRPKAEASLTRTGSDQSATAPSGPCAALPASANWPAEQIEREIDLNEAQREALAPLKAAIVGAVTAIKAACRDEATLPPHERLRVMQSTLWAVHESVIALRPPLAKFYESLTDAQRGKFETPAKANIDLSAIDHTAIARICGVPASGDSMFRQIDLVLKPSPSLRASLDVFQKRLAEMGQFLMASCLRPVPSTPAERLDAATDRLTAVTFAASTVNLALNDVYAQLTDEQKARFSPSR